MNVSLYQRTSDDMPTSTYVTSADAAKIAAWDAMVASIERDATDVVTVTRYDDGVMLDLPNGSSIAVD